jgi:DNA-binding NarL/FixJ family response regulator
VGLVGREPELATLEEAIGAARRGEQRTVGLLGEAGIGKSALMRFAAVRAGGEGLTVLEGRAGEHERDVPFALALAALDDRASELHPRRLEAAGPELAAVLPSAARAAGVAAELPAPGPAERFRYHRALRALLELLGRERPFALLVDDLHWADGASAEWILHLLHRPPRAPYVLVLASRRGAVADRILDAARSAPGWRELDLGPLSVAACDEVLAPVADSARRRRIAAEAQGNPLFLTELVRLGESGEQAELPGTVRAVVGRELAGLPDGARRLLEGAAVAGDPFDPDVAAAAAGDGAQTGMLDVLAQADLVHAEPGGRSFRFRHPLVLRAVYDGAPPAWRLAAHRRATALLTARGASPAVRAYHVERSAIPGDEEAIALLCQAAEDAVDRSPLAAAHWWSVALGLLAHDDVRRAGLLGETGFALSAGGELGRSREALEQALAALGPGRGRERWPLVRQLGLTHLFTGDFDAARARHEGELADAPPEGRAALLTGLANLAVARADFAGLREASDAAAGLLTEDAPPELRARLAAYRALIDLEEGRSPRARLEEADAAWAAREPWTPMAAESAWVGAYALLQAERYEDSLRLLEKGTEGARAAGHGHVILGLRSIATIPLMATLQLDAALESAEALEEASRLAGARHQHAFSVFERAFVHNARGDTAEARRLAEEAQRLFGRLSPGLSSRIAAAWTSVLLHGDDPPRLLGELTAMGIPGDGDRALVSGFLTPLVRAAIATGETDRAEEWTRRASERARRCELAESLARADAERAEVLLARGDTQAALVAARAGLDGAHSLLTLGVRTTVARALAAAGDRDGAVAELELVVAEAGAAGAGRPRDEAAGELRRLGARVSAAVRRASPDAGPEGLTEREQEIAMLVARGASNKQVASTVFLSEKTVEHHLSRVYAKLGVRGRTELAHRLRDRAPGL